MAASDAKEGVEEIARFFCFFAGGGGRGCSCVCTDLVLRAHKGLGCQGLGFQVCFSQEGFGSLWAHSAMPLLEAAHRRVHEQEDHLDRMRRTD